MEFIADKQTLNDLNMLGKYKNNSMFFIFNQVKTSGGEKLLDQFFHHPLTDHLAINERSKAFSYFQQRAFQFPFSTEDFELMENYLFSGGANSWMSSLTLFIRRKALKTMGLAAEYNQVAKGVAITIKLLTTLRSFLSVIQKSDPQNPFCTEINIFEKQFTEGKLVSINGLLSNPIPGPITLFRLDHLLRATLYQEMQELLAFVYKLDVYLAVGAVGRSNGWTYAIALPPQEYLLEMQDVRHPAISNAKGNPVFMDQQSNVLFLTGANMAGKSTFMKSYGIAIYLAHMGFPVAAKQMRFSVKSGIISSINVPDDLNKGFSHFYAEVLRVKQVAQLVKDRHNVVVIFDELFKGTNVKDAYDATLAVTEAFARFRNCQYIISTHIIEVGEALQQRCANMQFRYLPTIMEGNVPRYPYTMQNGITSDRHGMKIIENEKILELIVE